MQNKISYMLQISNKSPIGIFDSGLGGLTVFNEIVKLLPKENIIYFGDTARVPYGAKSPKIVERYTIEIVNFLLSLGVKMIVIACNTSTAITYEKIKKRLKIPVVGVIEPACIAADKISKNKIVGVIGTKITVQSQAYIKTMEKINSNITIFQKACPLFVPLVEEGITSGQVIELIANEYLSYFNDKNIDTLILGCTHYPLISDVISKICGSNVKIISSAEQTAYQVKDKLLKLNLLNDSKKAKGSCKFYLTDASYNFIKIGEQFLGYKMQNIKIVKVLDILI